MTRSLSRSAFCLILVLALAGSRCGKSENPVQPNPIQPYPGQVALAQTSASAHYATNGGNGQSPLDILLFFNAASDASAPFAITGTFSGGPGGLTGSISGSLRASAPASSTGAHIQTVAVPSGYFVGVLTANVSGCPISKNYSGPLSPSTLDWTAGTDVSTCAGSNPLGFNISAASTTDPPVVSTSASYRGAFSVTELDKFTSSGATTCIRGITINGTLTLNLTVASDGTVTGDGQALGTSTVATLISPTPQFSCSSTGSVIGSSGPFGTGDDAVVGTTSNFTFTDINTSAPGLTGQNVFSGRFSGSSIVGLFTTSVNAPTAGVTGTGTAMVTLNRQ